MSTTISLTVPDELYAEVEKAALNSHREVETLLLETIARSFTPISIDPQRAQMEKEIQAYQDMHAELIENYLGVYVAIYNGKLVDHDQDPVKLLQRIRVRFPQKVVLRRKVDEIKEPTLHFRHPKIVSND